MEVTLYSTGLDDLSPHLYRSPGIHASTLTDRICLRLGHYQRDKDGNPISDRNREMGNAFEDMVARRWQENHPPLTQGDYLRNPEILCDGVYITPDLVHQSDHYVHSVKWTWMSPANSPEDVKMWKYLEQGKAELYAMRRVVEGTAQIREACGDGDGVVWQRAPDVRTGVLSGMVAFLTLYLTVGFANDFRPPAQQIPTWKIGFFEEELAMTWAMLLHEKETLMAEERDKKKEAAIGA